MNAHVRGAHVKRHIFILSTTTQFLSFPFLHLYFVLFLFIFCDNFLHVSISCIRWFADDLKCLSSLVAATFSLPLFQRLIILNLHNAVGMTSVLVFINVFDAYGNNKKNCKLSRYCSHTHKLITEFFHNNPFASHPMETLIVSIISILP